MKLSVMTLDGNTLYFMSAAAIMKLLEARKHLNNVVRSTADIFIDLS
jgi:hypothetical protein